MTWVWLAALIILTMLLLSGWVFFRFAFARKGFRMPGKRYLEEGEADLRSWKNFMEIHERDVRWLKEQKKESLRITSDDGLVLHGERLRCEKPERIVLCVHGFRGSYVHDFASVSRFLNREHCDLYLIDQRAHGESEGNCITFGAKEKKDVQAWCREIERNNPDRLPVYLYGISMGSATVLLAGSEMHGTKINGIIADCGYSSIREILSANARRSFHMPPYPIMWFMELFCRMLAGFSFQDGDVKKALRENEIPVLFFHGSEDHFVTMDHTERNYEACASEKRAVYIEGGVHASSYNQNTPLYEQCVREFFAAHDDAEED